jgi:hypothetical protein
MVCHIFSSINVSSRPKERILLILIFPYHISKAKLLVTLLLDSHSSSNKTQEIDMLRSYINGAHLCTVADS